MGNCPSGFQASPKAPAFSCVHECPRQQGFDLMLKQENSACVYRDRPDIWFALREVVGLTKEEAVSNVADIQNPNKKADFQAAIEEFNTSSALALARIDKDTQLEDAFRELQTAENARDQSPQAYQNARIRYYTLLKGDAWAQEEAQRIEAAEAQPKVNEFLASYQDLNTRLAQQQKTIDVVNGVKDKILSMKDDFRMTTDVFSRQIAELKNQIQIEKRTKVEETRNVVGWIGMLLNVVLVIVLLALVILFGRKLMSNRPTYTSSPVVS